jgi:hypothetical protein
MYDEERSHNLLNNESINFTLFGNYNYYPPEESSRALFKSTFLEKPEIKEV